MQLAQAIQQRAATLAEAQNTYKQNVAMVNTYITGVMSSKLPTLNTIPPDWQDFVTAYEQANSEALNWVNNVMARLLDVPANVQGFNATISQALQDAKAQATTLVSQPSNQAALNALNAFLNVLSDTLGLITTFISGAITNLQNFKSVLPDMATQLQTIATKSANDANADKEQIKKLNGAIVQLQSDITSMTGSLVGFGIIDGIAITLGMVVTIAMWPLGALVWLLMGPAVAVATTYIVLDSEKLVADKNALSAAQAAITDLTKDVSTLSVLAQSYTAMVTQTAQIETALQAILVEWQTLETDVNQAVTDIRTATSDTSSKNFNAVLNDINGAITEWSAAYNQAGGLAITLQVNNAQLELGMSSQQVEQALAGGQTMDIIQYYNSIA